VNSQTLIRWFLFDAKGSRSRFLANIELMSSLPPTSWYSLLFRAVPDSALTCRAVSRGTCASIPFDLAQTLSSLALFLFLQATIELCLFEVARLTSSLSSATNLTLRIPSILLSAVLTISTHCFNSIGFGDRDGACATRVMVMPVDISYSQPSSSLVVMPHFSFFSHSFPCHLASLARLTRPRLSVPAEPWDQVNSILW
jgi:hypothetical protein